MTQAKVLPSQGIETRASNLVLPSTYWHWIDQRFVEIKTSWPSVKMNVIFQALLTVAMESDLDLTGVKDKDQLVETFRQAIGKQTVTKQTAVINEIEQLLQTLR